MTGWNRWSAWCLGIAVLAAWAGCADPEGGRVDDGRPRIAMIPKGTTHAFWRSVESGAVQAATDLDVNLVWRGPLREDDRAQQIELVEQFVNERVDGIVLAPLDHEALRRPVRDARSRDIPVVIFDSPLEGEVGQDFLSLVATDNRAAGYAGGQTLAEKLGGQGKVVLLRYQEGSASTMQREAGFLDAIAEYPDIEVIVDNRYGGATAGEAQQEAERMLDRLREADGIFTVNESSTMGMLIALRGNRIEDKVFVGFDSSTELLRGLRQGELQALISQNPQRMGYQALETMVAALRGESIEPLVDTGYVVVTPENVDDEEIRAVTGQ